MGELSHLAKKRQLRQHRYDRSMAQLTVPRFHARVFPRKNPTGGDASPRSFRRIAGGIFVLLWVVAVCGTGAQIFRYRQTTCQTQNGDPCTPEIEQYIRATLLGKLSVIPPSMIMKSGLIEQFPYVTSVQYIVTTPHHVTTIVTHGSVAYVLRHGEQQERVTTHGVRISANGTAASSVTSIILSDDLWNRVQSQRMVPNDIHDACTQIIAAVPTLTTPVTEITVQDLDTVQLTLESGQTVIFHPNQAAYQISVTESVLSQIWNTKDWKTLDVRFDKPLLRGVPSEVR